MILPATFLLLTAMFVALIVWLQRQHADQLATQSDQYMEMASTLASVLSVSLTTTLESAVKATLYPTTLVDSPGVDGRDVPLARVMAGDRVLIPQFQDEDYLDPTDGYILDPRDEYMVGENATAQAPATHGVLPPPGFTLEQAAVLGIGNVDWGQS